MVPLLLPPLMNDCEKKEGEGSIEADTMAGVSMVVDTHKTQWVCAMLDAS